MKLLETYANNCSVDISYRPNIVEKYFPLPFNKYITLQNKSGMPAKDYDWFQEVIDIIGPELEKHDIKIVLLGKEEPKEMQPPYRGTIDLRNQTKIGQAAYLIRKSLCHLSVDSWGCHFAGANNVPLVALYGSTTVKNHSPYHKHNMCYFLESHRNGNKASFARDENPKTVNLINPEDIARQVMDVLFLPFTYKYKTIEINEGYKFKTIESIPDQVINVSNLNISSLIVRMDYHFDENNLLGQLSHCKCSIVTDRPIKIDVLQRARPNVVEIIYNLKHDPKPDANFVKELFENKIPYRLLTFLTNEEVNQYRLDFMDWGIISVRQSKPLDNFDPEKIGEFYYKTNKFLVSSGKIYQSFYDYKNQRPIPNLQSTPQQIIKENLDYLWRDKESNYYLRKKVVDNVVDTG